MTARWILEDGVPVDSRSGVQLRVGFPAGAYDAAVGRRVAEYVAQVLNDHDADRRMRRHLRRVAARLGWPAAVAVGIAAVVYPPVAGAVALLWVGALVGVMVHTHMLRDRGVDLEALHARKDLAIDAAMNNAFEIERISGEHETVPASVPMYDQDADSGILCAWCPNEATGTIQCRGKDLPTCGDWHHAVADGPDVAEVRP